MKCLIYSMVARERRREPLLSSSFVVVASNACTFCSASKDEAERELYPDDLTRELLDDLQAWGSSRGGRRGSKSTQREDESAIAFVDEVLSSSRAAGEQLKEEEEKEEEEED